jgi:hypothetical protein
MPSSDLRFKPNIIIPTPEKRLYAIVMARTVLISSIITLQTKLYIYLYPKKKELSQG